MASIHLSDSTTITSDTCSMRQETQTDSTYFSKFPGLFADELQYALRLEMDGKVVLVDYDKFMGHFVPLPDKTVSLPRDELRGLRLEDVAVGSESTMYPVLADKLNQPWLCPGYHFVTTSDAASLEDPSNRRLIGGLYPVAETPEAGSCSDWASIEISIECQADEVSGDPFEDTMDSGLPNTDDRREILQRMTTVSSVVFVKQQRTHHFTVIVCGSSARISRWDHAGVVTTKKFNYKEEPEKLAEFFWRFARLSPAQRGHDTSVVRVLEGTEDYKLMQERAEEPRLLLEIHPVQEHAREAFRESLKGSRWWKIQVDDESSRESDPSAPTTPRFFLVGKPHFAARGLAGRGTRGYVAIDLQNPKRPFVYLKDAWRVAHTGIHKEGETLTYLNKEGVRNIPTKECHGDVGLSQTTMSQTIWREENPDALTCPLKTHTHYRLVVREVGLPMSEFQNAQELIFLVARCISAHGDAYRKGIMHRDISAGNVLILVTESVDAQGNLCTHRDGMLTDWELSKSVQDGQIDVLRQPDRTGTWQFLSANALRDPRKKITVEDEMESFFHLVLYFSIRYLPSNCPDVTRFMHHYFDSYTFNGEHYFAGMTKVNVMETGKLLVSGDPPLKFLRSLSDKELSDPPLHPINGFFEDLLMRLKAYYTLYANDHGLVGNSTCSTFRDPEQMDPVTFAGDRGLIASFFHSVAQKLDPPSPPQPTLSAQQKQDLEQLAEPLRNHDAMIERYGFFCLSRYLSWPKDDKVEDQMRTDFNPDKDPKQPKPDKSGKQSQARGASQAESPTPTEASSQTAEAEEPKKREVRKARSSRQKKGTLHNDDPFESSSETAEAAKPKTRRVTRAGSSRQKKGTLHNDDPFEPSSQTAEAARPKTRKATRAGSSRQKKGTLHGGDSFEPSSQTAEAARPKTRRSTTAGPPRRKRHTLHNDEPFEGSSRSTKRSTTG